MGLDTIPEGSIWDEVGTTAKDGGVEEGSNFVWTAGRVPLPKLGSAGGVAEEDDDDVTEEDVDDELTAGLIPLSTLGCLATDSAWC